MRTLQVQAALEAGPADNLDNFLDALQQLRPPMTTCKSIRRLAAVKSAVQTHPNRVQPGVGAV